MTKDQVSQINAIVVNRLDIRLVDVLFFIENLVSTVVVVGLDFSN